QQVEQLPVLVLPVMLAQLDDAKRKMFLDSYSKAYGEPVDEGLLKVFMLRDFALRTIWTLNKLSERHKAGSREDFLKSLGLLKRKTSELPKYL
ncbi:hypothetical protein ACFL3V_06600, partial [Nanoarchaeota archaeon]